MNTGAARYYREPSSRQDVVEDVGIGPNPWRKPLLHGTPHRCGFREAVDATYDDLAQHFQGWFFRARSLSDASTRDEIREVTGIRLKLIRAAKKTARMYLQDPIEAELASRALFDIYVFGTRAYEHYDRFRRRVFEKTQKRKEWVAKHEADPERIAAKRARREDEGVKTERRAKESDPLFRHDEAARKRAAYFAARGQPVPTTKSHRGRKPATPIRKAAWS